LVNLTNFQKQPNFNFKERNKTLMQTLNRMVYVPGNHNLAQEISLCSQIISSKPQYPVGLFIVGAVLVLPWLAKRKQEKLLAHFLVASFLSGIVIWILFPKNVSEYYLLPLFPLAFLSLAWVAEWLMSRGSRIVALGLVGVILGILAYNTYSVITMKNRLGLNIKKQSIVWAQNQISDQSYRLDSQEGCYQFEGYRYLFAHYFKPPAASYMDPYFFWLYPKSEQLQTKSNLQVVIQNSFDTGKAQERLDKRQGNRKASADFGELTISIWKK